MHQAQIEAMQVWDACYMRISGKGLIPITGVPADEIYKELMEYLKANPSGTYTVVCISRPESLRDNVPDDFDDWWLIPKEDFRFQEDYLSIWFQHPTTTTWT